MSVNVDFSNTSDDDLLEILNDSKAAMGMGFDNEREFREILY